MDAVILGYKSKAFSVKNGSTEALATPEVYLESGDFTAGANSVKPHSTSDSLLLSYMSSLLDTRFPSFSQQSKSYHSASSMHVECHSAYIDTWMKWSETTLEIWNWKSVLNICCVIQWNCRKKNKCNLGTFCPSVVGWRQIWMQAFSWLIEGMGFMRMNYWRSPIYITIRRLGHDILIKNYKAKLIY